MFSPLSVLVAIVAYIGFLFVLAEFSEHDTRGKKIASSAFVYSLGFAVYCTTWTYYGSVGNAASNGMLFVCIYTGPTLGFLIGHRVLRRVVELKHAHRITSVADFISARYAKSPAVAAIVTVGLMVGIVPYIALQLKAIDGTFSLITAGSSANPQLASASGYIIAALMIVFTILFGIRRLDPTERHPGMIASLAIESFVKVTAILCVGVLVIFMAFGGLGGFFDKLATGVPAHVNFMGRASAPQLMTWTTWTVLATGAYFLLPRQFHVGIVENAEPRHVKTAMWASPLYLFAINLAVLPIALGGAMLATKGTPQDLYVLALPLQTGHKVLSLTVFMGGFSAAIGMVMVETMTMATMISNHVLLPIIEVVKPLAWLRRNLLYTRWVAAALLILAGHWFAVAIGRSYMLTSIGLLSFAACFQLAPIILGGMYWQGASKGGAICGLSVAFVTWFYTLLMPTFVKSGWMAQSVLTDGVLGIHLLRPEALFGMTGVPALAHGTFWTTALNVLAYVGGSRLFRADAHEQAMAAKFLSARADHVDTHVTDENGEEANIDAAEKREKIEKIFARYHSQAQAVAMTERCFQSVGVAGRRYLTMEAWRMLFSEVERTLAGAVGAAGAHAATVIERGQGAVFGKYLLFASLGRGGMADVFLAVSRGIMGFNKLVVVKRMRAEDAHDATFVSMFLDEARLAARLNHPNIVQTLEVGECDGAYFIAMEYLEGQPLLKLVEAAMEGKVQVPEAAWVRIIIEMLNGLQYAHDLCDYDGTPLHIVHRDVSPHNIFVTYQGQVKVVDFGIAKASLNATATQVGMVKGKAAYMAPEQASGADVDHRADVFAAGVCLWEALTGKRLYEGDTIQALHKLFMTDIPRASTIQPSISPMLDEILARALEKEAARRFQSSKELREALEGYLKKMDQVVQADDIGRLMAHTFVDLREEIHRRIQRQMTQVVANPASGDVAAFGDVFGAGMGQASGGQAQGYRTFAAQRQPMAGARGGPSALPSHPDTNQSRAPLYFVAGGAAILIGAVSLSHKDEMVKASGAAEPAQATGAVFVMTEPQGAEVEWNGQKMGSTPVMLQLPVGKHTLLVSKDGYRMEPVVVAVLPKGDGGAGDVVSRALFLKKIAPPEATDRAGPAP